MQRPAPMGTTLDQPTQVTSTVERKWVDGIRYLQHTTNKRTFVIVTPWTPNAQQGTTNRQNPIEDPSNHPGRHKGLTIRPISRVVTLPQNGVVDPVQSKVYGTEVTNVVQQRPHNGAKRYLPGVQLGAQAGKPIDKRIKEREPIARPPVALNGVVTGMLRCNVPRGFIKPKAPANTPQGAISGNAPANDRYNVLIKASSNGPARVAMLDTSVEIQLVTKFMDSLVDVKLGKQACSAWATQKQIQVYLTYRRGHLTQISLTPPLMNRLMSYIL